MEIPELEYYRTVLHTQNDPEILKAELQDLINEVDLYVSCVDKHHNELQESRISILQYNSLRKYFQEMVTNILGKDYYNYEMDVYECDRQCCEDITHKTKEGFLKRLFSKKF